MTDCEKVVGNLQILRTWCAVNPRHGMGLNAGDCEKAVGWVDDALELLKERETIVPVLVRNGSNKQRSDYKCPKCNTSLYYGQRYCEWCGRKVKWDG